MRGEATERFGFFPGETESSALPMLSLEILGCLESRETGECDDTILGD